MMGQVFFHFLVGGMGGIGCRPLGVGDKPHSIVLQSPGVAAGLQRQTASFVPLLIGVIYCPNRRSSCGFTAQRQLNPDAAMKIRCPNVTRGPIAEY